jgi:molybdopterin synthase catalytic subunit
MPTIRVQTEDFDAGAEIAKLRAGNPKVGAIASFVGVCRDVNDGESVATMTLEHYPGMTEKALAKIVDEAIARWRISDVTVVHRVGEPADRSDRARRGEQRASRRRVRRVRVPHGLPQDARAVV